MSTELRPRAGDPAARVQVAAAAVTCGTLMSFSAVAQEPGPAASEFRVWTAVLILAGIVAVYTLVVRWLRRRAAKPETDAPAQGDGFSRDELERYARHIVLREIGGPGQQRLRRSRVMVVGAGGLGSPSLLYLAAAGVGTVGVIDDDIVQVSNLQRQIIHSGSRLDLAKTASAKEAMTQLNRHVEVVAVRGRLDAASADLLREYDVVLDGSDNFETRRLVNRHCVRMGIPLVFGAISQWEGQVSVFGGEGPCLECVFPEASGEGLQVSCAEGGVLGALPGVIGSMMAVEVIKLITGAGRPLRSRLLIFDALWGDSRMIELKRNPNCPVCGSGRNEGMVRSEGAG